MDATDVRILRSMGLLPFQRTPRDPRDLRAPGISKRLGVAQRTIKTRLERLRKEGILTSFEVYPNLRLLGLSWKSFHFRVTNRAKAPVLDEIAPIDGIVSAMDFLGPDLCIDIYYGDDAELDRRLRLLSTLTGGARPLEWYDNRMPQPTVSLTPLDWRIVSALRGDGLRSPDKVAASIGTTGRTVRRRLGRMLKGAALDIVPVIDFGRAKNVIPFALLLGQDPQAGSTTVRILLQMHESRYFWYWTPPGADIANFVIFLYATHSGEVEELRRHAERVSGVVRAETIIPAGGFENPAWLDPLISARAGTRGTAVSAEGKPPVSPGQQPTARVRGRRGRGRKA